MVKITSNKLALGLRGLFVAAVGLAAVSAAAPAQAYFHGHYWGGPRVSIGIGVGPCCWGPYWAGGYYYPYYYPYPYLPRPVRYYDDYAAPAPVGAVSLSSPWVREALDAPIGASIPWNDGAIHGSVTATRDGWAGNRYCRELRQSVTIDGRTRDAVGTACRTPNDQAWQLVPNQP